MLGTPKETLKNTPRCSSFPTKQMTFVDAGYAGKHKQPRKIEIDQMAPWKNLVTLMEPHHPRSFGIPIDGEIAHASDAKLVRLAMSWITAELVESSGHWRHRETSLKCNDLTNTYEFKT